jgi:Tfp pilus assembly PilM family ATPase
MELFDALQVIASSGRQGGDELMALVEAELHQSLEGYVLGTWPSRLQQEKLNVLTVPAAWSDQMSNDVSAGRWNCRALDSLPWALARAVLMADPSAATRTVAALDWGYGRATLTLVHEGAPAFVRCLKDCGYQQTLAAVQNELRLPTNDAEKVLQRHGLADGGGGVVADALAEPLHGLEHQLRRTLGYWQGQARGVKAETLYLFGGGAALRGGATRLAAALDLPVQPWDLKPQRAADAERLPSAYLLGPALAASALAWEASWPAA